MRFMSVVLPEPVEPMNATVSPLVGFEAHVAYDAAAAAEIGEAYVFKFDRTAHVAGIGDRAGLRP